tara:strand:+ start:1217 stop:1867 length:651 start_codon:yes stop_codon:yes gene_type:complete
MKSAIFDLDGVIVDTAKFHYFAWKQIAQKLNYKLTIVQNEKLKGISRKDSLGLLLKWSGRNLSGIEFNNLLIAKNSLYLDQIKNLTNEDSLPGINKTLEFFKREGVKIALGSASKNSKIVLNKLSLIHFFDTIIDGNDVINSKPNPEVFIKGAKSLGVPNSDCIVFEDSIAGIKAAKLAMMDVIGICEPNQNLKHTILNIKSFLEIEPTNLIKYFK